eukprot:7177142-Heterocapsa_arctica.AAC.1
MTAGARGCGPSRSGPPGSRGAPETRSLRPYWQRWRTTLACEGLCESLTRGFSCQAFDVCGRPS